MIYLYSGRCVDFGLGRKKYAGPFYNIPSLVIRSAGEIFIFRASAMVPIKFSNLY